MMEVAHSCALSEITFLVFAKARNRGGKMPSRKTSDLTNTNSPTMVVHASRKRVERKGSSYSLNIDRRKVPVWLAVGCRPLRSV